MLRQQTAALTFSLPTMSLTTSPKFLVGPCGMLPGLLDLQTVTALPLLSVYHLRGFSTSMDPSTFAALISSLVLHGSTHQVLPASQPRFVRQSIRAFANVVPEKNDPDYPESDIRNRAKELLWIVETSRLTCTHNQPHPRGAVWTFWRSIVEAEIFTTRLSSEFQLR